MCGRYSLWCIDDLCGRFRLLDPTLGFRSHFNIAPGSTNPVIVAHERAEVVMMQWGLVPHWAKDITETHRPINARSENLTEKPMFRDLLKSRRCLVPASGFFEWKKEAGHKVPFYIHVKDDPVFQLCRALRYLEQSCGNNPPDVYDHHDRCQRIGCPSP